MAKDLGERVKLIDGFQAFGKKVVNKKGTTETTLTIKPPPEEKDDWRLYKTIGTPGSVRITYRREAKTNKPQR